MGQKCKGSTLHLQYVEGSTPTGFIGFLKIEFVMVSVV